MILKVTNNWTWVQEASEVESYFIHEKLSVDTSGLIQGSYVDAEGNLKFGLHWSASQWSSYDLNANRFPTGLLWRVIEHIPPDHLKVIDARTNMIFPERQPEDVCVELGLDPRDYQIDTVKHGLTMQRGIFNIATNGGKTEIMAMLVLCYPPETCTTIVAPDLTALTEICERFDLRGIEYSIIDSGNKNFDLNGVNVCSLDSLARLEDIEELLKVTKVLLWDECDDSAAAVSGWDLGMMCNAYVRLYMSGTAFTDSIVQNMKLIGVAGEEIVNISNAYLIDRGFSAKPTVIIHSSAYEPYDAEKVKYSEARKWNINENEDYANIVMEDVREHIDKGCVVLFEQKTHGRLLHKIFTAGGLRAKYIDGGSLKTEREEAKRMLLNGFIDVVLASSIWNRALDFGYPEHWFFVGGFKATNRIKQRWGRSLRKKKNETNEVWIHEYFNFGHKALEEHSRLRYELAVKEGFTIQLDDDYLPEYLNRKTKHEVNKINFKDVSESSAALVQELLKGMKS